MQRAPARLGHFVATGPVLEKSARREKTGAKARQRERRAREEAQATVSEAVRARMHGHMGALITTHIFIPILL